MTNQAEYRVEQKFEEIQESHKENLQSILEGTFKSKELTEADVTDEKSLTDYAMAIASKAHGDEVDVKIVNDIVKNAIEKSEGDWGTAAGIVSGSFTESACADKDEDKELIVDEEGCPECKCEPCECEKVEEAGCSKKKKMKEEEECDSEEDEESEEEKDED